MRLSLSAVLLLALVPSALAVDAVHADQIIPAEPRLQLVGRDSYGVPIWLETTTIGRVGDTGYVWQVSLAKNGNGIISWTHLVIDCPIQTVAQDWVSFFDTALTVVDQHPDTIVYQASAPLERYIVAAVCLGFPLAPDPVLKGMAELIAWVGAAPDGPPPAPANQPDADLTPPTFFVSLLPVFHETTPPMTAYLEENWTSRDGEDALTWQFFAFPEPVPDKGQTVIGGWYRVRYHCNAPRTASVTHTVPVGISYEMLPGHAVTVPDHPVTEDAPDRLAAAIACGTQPAPADLPRYATIGQAIRASK